MNFDKGFNIGNFFVSWIINDLFCGISIRIGKDEPNIYHLTIQIGYGQLSVGFIGKSEGVNK